MQLSNRLKAVAGLISHGKRLADVGTDHGYIPIYLVQKGMIDYAIAMDIRTGPLEHAKEHIRQFGLENRIETRLSDGVQKLQAEEADCMIAAGMGGGLTIHILEEGAELVFGMKECILQPQSEIAKVRKYVWKHEFFIEEENMILEDGKFYPMMRVIPGKHQEIPGHLTELYAQYGPYLLENRHPVLKQLLEKEDYVNRQLRIQLEKKLPGTRVRLQELQVKQNLIEQALNMVNTGNCETRYYDSKFHNHLSQLP